MSSDKNIDKLFRDKLENREFELSEDSQKAAANLIIANGKKAVWFSSKLWLGLSVVAIIAVMLPFIIDNEQEELLTSVPEQNDVLTAETDVSPIETDVSPAETDVSGSRTDVSDSQTDVSGSRTDVSGSRTDVSGSRTDVSDSQTGISDSRTDVSGSRTGISNSETDVSSTDTDVSHEEMSTFPEQIKSTGEGHISDVVAHSETVYLPLEKMDYLSFPGFNSQDNSSVDQLSKGQQPFKDRLNWLRRGNFGIITGANISQGFVNGTSRANLSVRPLAGIRFAYSLNHMVSLGMNALYHIRGGLNSEIAASDLSEAQSQGLNEYTITTTNTLSLHYLDFPVFLQYRKNRHTIVIGLQYSYLLTTYSKVNNLRQKTSGGVLSDKTTKEWGNKDAFVTDDVQGLLGYEWAWNEKFDIGVRLNYGLFDITDDESFGTGVSIDKNLQIRAMITYKLLRY